MKRLLTIVCTLLIASAAQAITTIPSLPDYTMLWSRYSSVSVVDTFIIATARQGLVIHKAPAGTLDFKPVRYVFLNSSPVRQKRFGSTLVVQTNAGVYYFFDLASLPDPTLLGHIDIGQGANDFVLRGEDFYVSFGFNGLKCYQLSGHQSARFVDSSIIGVDYRQVELMGDTLYAVDSYNGILRYHVDSSGFAGLIDFLYLPFSATSFVAFDSSLVIASRNNRLMLADARTSPPTIVDSVPLLITPTRILPWTNSVVVVDSTTQFEQVIYLDGTPDGLAQLTEPPEPNLRGQVAQIAGKTCLVLPARKGGALLYDMSDLSSYTATPVAATAERGLVTGFVMRDHRLIIGGERNAVDIYDIGNNGTPTYRRTMFSGLNQVASIQQVGDSTIVFYPQLRRALTFQVEPDQSVYCGSLYFDTTVYRSVQFNSQKIDTLRSWFLIGDSRVGLVSVSDSNLVTFTGEISVVGQILDVTLVDTLVAISTDKGIWVYRIFPDFSVEYRFTFAVDFKPVELRAYRGKLMIFSGSDVLLADTLANLPSMNEVYHSAIEGERMYVVGSGGVAVLDISLEPFRVLAYGGRDGYRVAVENGIVAVSDSSSLHLYDLSGIPTGVDEAPVRLPAGFALGQNYPNPFNPSTTIRYSLARRERIVLDVFNILGQQVRTLVDAEQSSGEHSVIWDGRNKSGHPSATGVYFYRLSAESYSETRKMILLK
jgi:hypothetical protein